MIDEQYFRTGPDARGDHRRADFQTTSGRDADDGAADRLASLSIGLGDEGLRLMSLGIALSSLTRGRKMLVPDQDRPTRRIKMMSDSLMAELARQHREESMRKAEAWRQGEPADDEQPSASGQHLALAPWRAVRGVLAALRPAHSH